MLTCGTGAPDGVWAIGSQFSNGKGGKQTGPIADIPKRPQSLVDGAGKIFTKSKPQYEFMNMKDDFLSAKAEGIANDGKSGDQSSKINAFLQKAHKDGKVAYFPAGIYLVEDTITIPVNSRVQGTLWSQASTFAYCI